MAKEDLSIPRRDMLKAAAVGGAALSLAGAGSAFAESRASAAGPLRDSLFDADWRFHLGDAADAWQPEFDDSAWRRLSLPHDWSIEDRPGAPTEAEGWVPPVALWNPGPHPKDAKTVSLPPSSR